MIMIFSLSKLIGPRCNCRNQRIVPYLRCVSYGAVSTFPLEYGRIATRIDESLILGYRGGLLSDGCEAIHCPDPFRRRGAAGDRRGGGVGNRRSVFLLARQTHRIRTRLWVCFRLRTAGRSFAVSNACRVGTRKLPGRLRNPAKWHS